jgi:hypothetical protein
MIAIGQFFFRFRNAIFPLVMLLAVLLARPHYSLGSLATDWLVDLVGLATIFAGQTLRVITIGYDYIRRGAATGASLPKGWFRAGSSPIVGTPCTWAIFSWPSASSSCLAKLASSPSEPH